MDVKSRLVGLSTRLSSMPIRLPSAKIKLSGFAVASSATMTGFSLESMRVAQAA